MGITKSHKIIFLFSRYRLLHPYFMASKGVVVDSARKSNCIARGIDAFPAVIIKPYSEIPPDIYKFKV